MNLASEIIRQTTRIYHAVKGITIFLKTDKSAPLHFIASLVAIAAGFFFGISPIEWIVVISMILLVFAAEMINSALEACVDLAQPEWHQLAGKAKDLAAGAVLLLGFIAMLAGAFIFLPKVFHMIFL